VSGLDLRKRWFAAVYGRLDQRLKVATAPMRRELLSDLTGDILDVGCGPGTNFEHYRADAHVTAVDYSEHMLPLARRTLLALPQPHAVIEVRQADATDLPFRDASFDAYVSTLVLCSVDDLDAAVEEAWRVLRPGGALRLLEHIRSATPWKARLQSWLNPAWGLVADGCHLDRLTHRAFIERGFEVVEERHPDLPGEPMPVVALRARKPA